MPLDLPNPVETQEEFHLEQRQLVVRVFRILMPFALPIYAWMTVPSWLAGTPDLFLTTQTLLFTVITAVFWVLGDRHLSMSVALWHVGFLLATSFALISQGPGIGVGMMFLAWTLSAVFFYGVFWPPPVIFFVTFLSLGYLISTAVIPVDWSYPGHNKWLQMGLSGLLLVFACDYLIMRLLRRARTTLEEKLAAQISMANAQRLESVGRLAGGVAHDFNNALMVIMGTLDLLKIETDPQKQEALINQIDRAAEGARATTQQLVSFTRQAAMPGGSSNVTDSLTDVGESMRRLLPEQIQVVVENQQVPDVAIAPGQLQQVLLNLCLNARDAMPDGGTLMLRSQSDQGSVVVEVEDTGAGVSEDSKDQMFNAFFTTKQGMNSGLGLTMVNRIVHEAGGSVDFQQGKEVGTIFRISLPTAGSSIVTESQSESGSPSLEDKTILFLEDDPQVHATITSILASAGFNIVEAASVKESMAVSLDDVDLVLTDAVLPDGNPRSLIEKCHSQNVPVFVCSGYMRDDVLDQEVTGFLQKPVGRKTLLSEIGKALI